MPKNKTMVPINQKIRDLTNGISEETQEKIAPIVEVAEKKELSSRRKLKEMSDRELLEQIMLWIMDLSKQYQKPMEDKSVEEILRAKLTKRTKGNRMPKVFKDMVAEELLRKLPLTREELSRLSRYERLILARALKVGKLKAFGKSDKELIDNLLEAQGPFLKEESEKEGEDE